MTSNHANALASSSAKIAQKSHHNNRMMSSTAPVLVIQFRFISLLLF